MKYSLATVRQATNEDLTNRVVELYVELIEEATPTEGFTLFRRLKDRMNYTTPGDSTTTPDTRVYMWCKEKIFQGMEQQLNDLRWKELELVEEWLNIMFANMDSTKEDEQ